MEKMKKRWEDRKGRNKICRMTRKTKTEELEGGRKKLKKIKE